eukprot:TRINITY_DN2365_c0_g1_i1.p1 TRINITY_DN2365_c0_g1~~TRINITY_DN2365_c0_g1_i1.p1  ORF type:complete len:679 (+),score=258.24 TRINITY_DN2365_c0_g1_i1:93-2039(+)
MADEAVPFISDDGEDAAPSPLSEGVVTLAWKEVKFEVKTAGGEVKRVLEGVTGNVKAGRLTAVMGPSGAGKSSFLNIIAGRMSAGGNKVIDGNISFKGKQIDPVSFRKRIAYVMQEDALFATQTCFEALEFSAAMRLPQSIADKERQSLCESMLTTLGLKEQRDTYVGSKTVAGLSGGQKKRLACGIELITNPDILFLDEPTSGLDSYAAMRLCHVLRLLARGHEATEDDGGVGKDVETFPVRSGTAGLRPRSVVCTIHQPSSEVFELFDDVILLGLGGCVYCGPRELMSSCRGGDFFGAMGMPCPEQYNPADFVMFALQKKDCTVTPAKWTKYREEMEASPRGLGPRQGSSRIIQADSGPGALVRAGLPRQIKYLGVREARNLIRDKKNLIARFGTSIFIMLLVGIVFKAVGSKWDTQSEVRDHFGALSQIAISGMFGISQPVLLSMPLERPIFLREYAAGTYSVFPYLMCKLLVDIPIATLQACVMMLLAYWLLELTGVFPFLVLAVALIGLAGSGLALVIGSIAGDPSVAIQLSPILFVPQFLFAGVFVATSQIPKWIRWAQYLCSLKYGINLLAIAEFDGEHHLGRMGNRTFDLIHDDEHGLFDQMDIRPDQKWLYFGIMMFFFLGLRVVASFILTRRARTPVQ